MKVEIVKSTGPAFWYADKIGQEFDVMDSSDYDQYVLYDNMRYIRKEDAVLVSWGIDAAWDGPVAATYDKTYYTYPATKEITVKKTIEQLAIEVLQNTTGKTYTEREIMAVVAIVDAIRATEK